MAGYFGTDGIRGTVGEGKLTDDSLARMAGAIGAHFGPGKTALIGRDTRGSGPHIQSIIEQGLLGQGVDVVRLGVLPTPGTALMTQSPSADFGLMITASHNPYTDNGVKLFGADGRKISDADQTSIEALIDKDVETGEATGNVSEKVDAAKTYTDFLITASGSPDLSSLSIAVDCANGAASAILPDVLRTLGATVAAIGNDPDGENINRACGSTHPEALVRLVGETGADVGVALDGDADRLILIDSDGGEIDGDQVLARLATDWQAAGTLRGRAVVSTVMANLGLERYLATLGLALERTAVGDRYVAARMAQMDANLGGEPSGHILLTDHATTGDGSLAALMMLGALADGRVLRVFEPLPQIMKNVRYDGPSPLQRKEVQPAIAAMDARLGDAARILVRASGTEPLIRVMAEGEDAAIVSQAVDELCAIIEKAAR